MADAKKRTNLITKTSASNVIKRPNTSVMASSSRVSHVGKDRVGADRPGQCRPKINKNATLIGNSDVTCGAADFNFPEVTDEHVAIAYSKFLRGVYEECLVDEKIEREPTEIDIQMSHLAKRFSQTIEQLDETNRRVNEISFAVEEKRLLDLKNKDTTLYFDVKEKYNSEKILKDLRNTEQASLDRLLTKNVDFGYNKQNGHEQLLDAVNDAINGLETIKKHSELDLSKFKQYEKTQMCIEEMDKERTELEAMLRDFEKKFPRLNEKMIKEAADCVSKYMESDGEGSNDDED